MEFVIGIKGKDFVLIGADQSAMRSVIVYQQELDKIHPIGKKTALAGKHIQLNTRMAKKKIPFCKIQCVVKLAIQISSLNISQRVLHFMKSETVMK